MDKQIRNQGQSIKIADFIAVLEIELSGNKTLEEKATDIKEHLNSKNMDYYTLQTIIDILVSIPETNRNESIARVFNQLQF